MIGGLTLRRRFGTWRVDRPAIQVFVRFGPVRNDCRQAGICDIRLRPETGASAPGGYCLAILCPVRRTLLFLHVIKASLTPAVQARQFTEGWFQLDEPFALPRPVRRQLKIHTKIYLEAGCYAVADLGGHLSVALPLRPPPDGRTGGLGTRGQGTGGQGTIPDFRSP